MHKIHNYDAVNTLSKILNYQIATSILFLLVFMGGIAMTLAIIAAVLFTPYLLYVLFGEKRYGYIIAFLILVMLPTIVALLFGFVKNNWSVIFMITLGFFYFYCFMIKYPFKEWIREYNWAQQLEEQKREAAINQKKVDQSTNIRDIL